MTGAERSFVTVGRSFTVAKGFSLLGRRGEKKIVRQGFGSEKELITLALVL